MKRVKINRLIHNIRNVEPLFQYQRFNELGITNDDLEKFKKSKIGKSKSFKKKKISRKNQLISTLKDYGFYAEAFDVMNNRPIKIHLQNKYLFLEWEQNEFAVSNVFINSRSMPFIESLKMFGKSIRGSEIKSDLTSML